MSSRITLPKGLYHDRTCTAHGQIIDREWRSNLIVDRCRFLIAGFMRGDGSAGIQRLKIGRGLESWDIEPPDPPSRTAQQLTDSSPFEIVIGLSEIEYLDQTDAVTTGPSNRIQITVTLGENAPPVAAGETTYPLREFGLFGEFEGEEFMINYVRHPVIQKPMGDSLIRTIRLVF